MKIHERIETMEKLQDLSSLEPPLELRLLGINLRIQGDEISLCNGVMGDYLSLEDTQKAISWLADQLGLQVISKTKETASE